MLFRSEHNPPAIADISGEEAIVYDFSEMVEAKHYSLNNRRIAAVEETDLKLYEINNENKIIEVSSTKIDSSTGAVMLKGSYIYTVSITATGESGLIFKEFFR